MAAATLIIVCCRFYPALFKEQDLYHAAIPGRAIQRNGEHSHALFWLLVYVLSTLTSIIYLGALAVSAISGISFEACIADWPCLRSWLRSWNESDWIHGCISGFCIDHGWLGNHLPGADFGNPIILDMEMMSGKDWL